MLFSTPFFVGFPSFSNFGEQKGQKTGTCTPPRIKIFEVETRGFYLGPSKWSIFKPSQGVVFFVETIQIGPANGTLRLDIRSPQVPRSLRAKRHSISLSFSRKLGILWSFPLKKSPIIWYDPKNLVCFWVIFQDSGRIFAQIFAIQSD